MDRVGAGLIADPQRADVVAGRQGRGREPEQGDEEAGCDAHGRRTLEQLRSPVPLYDPAKASGGLDLLHIPPRAPDQRTSEDTTLPAHFRPSSLSCWSSNAFFFSGYSMTTSSFVSGS